MAPFPIIPGIRVFSKKHFTLLISLKQETAALSHLSLKRLFREKSVERANHREGKKGSSYDNTVSVCYNEGHYLS